MKTVAAALFLVAVSQIASADDALPSLTFQGDASGKEAKLKAGFDLRYGAPISWIVSPFFEGTTTEGVADLFTFNSKGVSASGSWNLGVVVSSLQWRASATDADAAGTSLAYLGLSRRAFTSCVKYCTDPKLAPLGGDFCTKRKTRADELEAIARARPEIDPVLTNALLEVDKAEAAAKKASEDVSSAPEGQRDAARAHADELAKQATALRANVTRIIDDKVVDALSPSDFCPEQKPQLLTFLNSHYDAWSAVPANVWQAGMSVGLTVDKYLKPSNGSFSLENPTHTTESLGVMLIHSIPNWALEAPFVAQRKFALATSKKAKWCVPAGAVVDSMEVSTPAETCNEQPIGPLSEHYSLQASLIISRFSPSNFWRIGIGPQASFSPAADGEAKASYRIGLTTPLYIGTNLLKKDLKGLVRLSAGVFASRDADGTTDKTVSVNVTIFATTTLFPGVFDQFH